MRNAAGSHLVSAFGAYTSGSRHREQSFIITSDGAERAEVIGRRPLGDRRELNRSDVLDNLTRNFARQPEKESALSLIDRAADLRRGTIRTVQNALQPLEARAAEGMTPSSLPNRLIRRRLGRMLHDRLPGLAGRLRHHGEAIAKIASASLVMAEHIAAVARRHSHKYSNTRTYWRKVAASGAPTLEQSEAQKLHHRRGQGR